MRTITNWLKTEQTKVMQQRYEITLHDVCESAPLSIGGLDFDAYATVHLHKIGPDGKPYVDEISIRNISVMVLDSDYGYVALKLDEKDLFQHNKDLYDAFEAGCVARAITIAEAAHNWKWQEAKYVDGDDQ